MKKKIRSHVQMPRGVLSEFEDASKHLYCYDVTRKRIITSNSKDINVEKGYYSVEWDHFMGRKIESPFFEIVYEVKCLDFDAVANPVPKNFREAILSFLYALMVRDPLMFRTVSLYERLVPLLISLQQRHDLTTMVGLQEASKKKLFDDYIITVLKNETEIPFILSTKGIYEWGEYIIFPITPKLAIILLPMDKDVCQEWIQDGKIPLLITEDKDEIMSMNITAFISQVKRGTGYIVSNYKELIVYIHDYIFTFYGEALCFLE